jgi:hypothetical protein
MVRTESAAHRDNPQGAALSMTAAFFRDYMTTDPKDENQMHNVMLIFVLRIQDRVLHNSDVREHNREPAA